MKKILVIFGFAFLCCTACQKNTGEQKAESNVKGVTNLESQPKTDDKANAPKAVIKFETETYNFGTINQGQKVTYAYKFKNEGENPLIIQSANASCGCTVPTYPKDPIPPGGTGEIVAEYNGSGAGDITKTITITANTEPTTTVLTIKGFVKTTNPQNGEINKMKGPLRNQ